VHVLATFAGMGRRMIAAHQSKAAGKRPVVLIQTLVLSGSANPVLPSVLIVLTAPFLFGLSICVQVCWPRLLAWAVA
jgi:hypothetical protein